MNNQLMLYQGKVLRYPICVFSHSESTFADENFRAIMGRYVISNANTGYGDLGLKPEDEGRLSEWQSDLFDCCREPCLCEFF